MFSGNWGKWMTKYEKVINYICSYLCRCFIIRCLSHDFLLLLQKWVYVKFISVKCICEVNVFPARCKWNHSSCPKCIIHTHSHITHLEKKKEKTSVPSMIHSARPTVTPIAVTSFAWKLLCFARLWKVGTDGWIDNTCGNSDHYRPWLWVDLVDQKKEKLKSKEWKKSHFCPWKA